MNRWKDPKNWIYLLLILSPIFDLMSSLIRLESFSLALFLRPLIPLGLLLYLFIKEKKTRPYLLIGSMIYLSYAILHLYYYRQIHNTFSYGNWIYEATYLCNYIYLIFTLFLFLWIFRKESPETLQKYTFYYALIYMGSIVLSLITRTSFPTYTEGFGYKGWFHTGGAVGSILIGLLFILLPYLLQKKEKLGFKIAFLLITLIYLMFLLGTRVGLLGGVIAVGCYLIFSIIFYLVKKQKENKWMMRIGLGILVLLITGVFLFGSQALSRRKQLDDLAGKIPGDTSGTIIYMAYDLVKLKDQIIKNQLTEDDMSKEQKEAILKLDEYSTKHQLISTDLRKQQVLYHHFLWKEQTSWGLKFFGNGYLSNMGMLTLEMEFIAFFYNFGILGFLLFAGPFLTIFVYSFITGIRHIKKIDVTYLMLLAGCFMTYAISILAGHTYFNTSVMIVILLLHTFLFQKALRLKEGSE